MDLWVVEREVFTMSLYWHVPTCSDILMDILTAVALTLKLTNLLYSAILLFSLMFVISIARGNVYVVIGATTLES